MNVRAFLFAFATALTAMAFAQDSLFYKNGNVIIGQVEQIGLDVIKYRPDSDGRDVLIEVDKQNLSRVSLKGGQAYSFTPDILDVPYSAAFLGRKNALAFDVMAPAFNHFTIVYERVLAPRISLMVKGGYIGLWQEIDRRNDVYASRDGGLFTAGVKFILPRSAKRTTPSRDAHPLAGWYLRPEVLYSAWTRGTYYDVLLAGPQHYYVSEKKVMFKYASTALLLSIGREFFLGEHITFDICGGFGYGAESREEKKGHTGDYKEVRQMYAFSHVFLNETSPFVLNGGLRFGYAF